MATIYVGTSSECAPLLAALGWRGLRAHASVGAARRDAVTASVRDGAWPVVLTCDYDGEVPAESDGPTVTIDPMTMKVHEVVDADTAEARLGFSETAGLADIVGGLLKTLDFTHNTLRDALDVGRGASNVDLPHFNDLKRAGAYIKDKFKRKVRNKSDAEADEDGDGFVDQKEMDKARKLAHRGLRKHAEKVRTTINKHLNKLNKTKSVKGPDKLNKKKGLLKPVMKAKAPIKKKSPAADWKPDSGPSPAPKYGPVKTASKDITIKIDTKSGTKNKTIRAGTQYRVSKSNGGGTHVSVNGRSYVTKSPVS